MEHTTGHSASSGGRKLNSCPQLPASRSPSFMLSQKVIMIWFVLFTTHGVRQVLAGTRNETYIREIESDSVPVWNQTKYRQELECKDFRNKTDRMSEKFFYWPEDNPLFQYCCTNAAQYNSKNDTASPTFRYSDNGEELMYAKYRDVGYFDQCMPFWNCRKRYRNILHTNLYVAFCEKTDLAKLYWERFWKLTVWKYSLQLTILPWLLILESAVILLALTIFPFTWRIASENLAKTFGWKDLVPTGKIWLKSIWRRLLMDWGHMYLLVIVGNGLFEATRRQNVYSMQSKLFFAYSMLYFLLFIILSCTTFVQQLAYWIESATELKAIKCLNESVQSSIDKESDNVIPKHFEAGLARAKAGHIKKSRVAFATSDDDKSSYGHDGIELAEVENIYLGDASDDKMKSQAEIGINIDEKWILECTQHDDTTISTESSSLARLIGCSFSFKRPISKKLPLKKIKGTFRNRLSEVFKLGDDYKWQPIATQATILFALGNLLTMSVDSDSDSRDLFGLLLGFFVQAGCLWTGIYSVVVFFQRAAYVYRFFQEVT